MRAIMVGLVLATGCATLAPVEVTQDFRAPPADVQAAAQTAAARLGWAGPAPSPALLNLTDTPQPRAFPLEVHTDAASTLHVVTPTPEGMTPEQTELQPAGELLLQATRQVLNPADVPPAAQPVAPRLLGLTVILDLVLPEVGGVYARTGDPLLEGHWRRGWPFNLMMTSLLDLLGAINLGAGFYELNQNSTRVGITNVLVGVVCLTVNRVGSAIADGSEVLARNRLAASGFAFDLTDLPLPRPVQTP